MFGNNPILPPEVSDGSVLKIHSLFRTFQGEGPYAGYPAVFIRLSGCNLTCSFCDTEFDTFQEMPVDEILQQTNTLSANLVKLIVITGGEPFRQNLMPLCVALLNHGYSIQIETNGTLYRKIPNDVQIVCSPKNVGNGYKAIREDVLNHTVAIKFLISAHDNKYCDVTEVGQKKFNIPVYLQPMDEYDHSRNRANQIHTLKLAEKYGYRVGIQMHKVLQIA